MPEKACGLLTIDLDQLDLDGWRDLRVKAGLIVESQADVQQGSVVDVVDLFGQLQTPRGGHAGALEDTKLPAVRLDEQGVVAGLVVGQNQRLLRLHPELDLRGCR